jgi:hypothetical protein
MGIGKTEYCGTLRLLTEGSIFAVTRSIIPSCLRTNHNMILRTGLLLRLPIADWLVWVGVDDADWHLCAK